MANKNQSNVFKTSGKTARSPPVVDHSKLFNCRECRRPDSHDDMVECGKCLKWFHYSCAKVDDSVKKLKWNCKHCSAAKTIGNEKAQREKGAQPKVRTTQGNASKSNQSQLNSTVKDTPIDQGFGFVSPIVTLTTTKSNNENIMSSNQLIIPSTNAQNPITSTSVEIPNAQIPSSETILHENVNTSTSSNEIVTTMGKFLSSTEVPPLKVVTSTNDGNNSVIGSTTSSKRKQLALLKLQEQKLQEQFKLRAQREEEYTDLKFKLLQEQQQLEDTDEEIIPDVDRSSITEQWVHNQAENLLRGEGEKFDLINHNDNVQQETTLSLAISNVDTLSLDQPISQSVTNETKNIGTNNLFEYELPKNPVSNDFSISLDKLLAPDDVIKSSTTTAPVPRFNKLLVAQNLLAEQYKAKLDVILDGGTLVSTTSQTYASQSKSISHSIPNVSIFEDQRYTHKFDSAIVTPSQFGSRPICSTNIRKGDPVVSSVKPQIYMNDWRSNVPDSSCGNFPASTIGSSIFQNNVNGIPSTRNEIVTSQSITNCHQTQTYVPMCNTQQITSSNNFYERNCDINVSQGGSYYGSNIASQTVTSRHQPYAYAPISDHQPVIPSSKFIENNLYANASQRNNYCQDGSYYGSNIPIYNTTNANISANQHHNQSFVPNLDQDVINPNPHQHESANPFGYQQTLGRQRPISYQSSSANNYGPMNMSMSFPMGIHEQNGNMSPVIGIQNQNMMPDLPNITRSQIAARQVLKKELPFFYGDPERWPMFINRFENSTAMCGYTNGENLTRLQDCLKGRAYDAVSGRLLQPENVPAIIETLRTLFGRPELIINSCLQKMEKEPSPKADDIESLIKFAFAVEGLCSTIVTCGCTTYLADRTLLQKITDKLPTQLKLNWAIFKQSVPNADLSTLGNWLNNIAQAASQIIIPSSSERDYKQEKRRKEENRGTKDRNYIATHIEPELKTPPPESPEKPTKFCKICDRKNHSITECRTFQGYKSKEKWAAIRKFKLCRNCLDSHSWNSCKKKQQCGKDGCTSLHHPLLHSQAQSSEEKEKKNSVFKKGNTKLPVAKIETCQHNAHTSRQPVIYRIVPVIIHGPIKSIHTYAYLDDGSSFTLMEEGITKELGLTGTPEAICLEWTRKIIRTEPDSRRVTITISGVASTSSSDGDMQKYKLLDVRTVPILGLPAQTISQEIMKKMYPYIEDIPLKSYENGLPRILIGLPHAKLTNTLATVEGKWNQPIATKTRLGWVLHGANGQTSSDQSFVGTHIARKCICMEDGSLHNLVKDYIRSDNLDITPCRTLLESKDNQRARYLMDNFIIRKNGRYEAPLLWRFNDVSLPDNYAMAFKRLLCLENKMTKDPELAAKIKDQMKSHLQKNYIRKLTKEELKVKHPNTYYLPIFNAVNPKKPMKTRIVWDGAAKYLGVSLNSMLLTGPDQLTPLPDVLRRFRERCVALGGDIVEMFHQILVCESDQHSQRFLWRDNPEDEPEVYVMQVLTFGATCSPSIAQHVKNKNAENYKRKFPRAEQAITKNTYMDDLLDSVHTEAEAIKLLEDVKYINKQAGFNMRGFISNSPNVLKAIGEEVSLDSKNLNLDAESYVERVLGMFWNPNTDMFTYSLKFLDQNILKGEKSPTKREMLRMLMSIFDPLGFLSFFLINAKIILQETWRTKLDWDDQLTGELRDRWFSWIKLLPEIEKIRIPRLYSKLMSPDEPEDIQLHVFVDGSQSAYCTVAYYRVQKGNQIECCIIGAKTKVGPIRPLSIPRMELQGAVIGSRFLTSIIKSHTLQISRSYIWTDSATVIRWLNSSSRRYHQYVSCRIGEILENTNSRDWRWLKSQDNVADLGSKWNDTPNFNYNSRWFIGPEFLSKPESEWPKNIDGNESTSEEEIRPHFHIRSTLREIFRIQPERFSNYHRMVNALAYAYRYLFNLKAKVRQDCPRTGALLPEEMAHAETMLFRQAQFEIHAEEVIVLQKLRDGSAKNDEKLDKTSQIYHCSPYMDEKNLMRINGRIDAVKGVAESVKRPIILPRKHRITFLLVDSYHQKLNHQNQETVVNEIRQKFWIPHLRTLVKSVKSECRKCKISRATPQPPQMAPLPEARLSISNPVFTYVGVDYFGPLMVKVPIGTRNAKRNEKRWVVLFTCLTIRAIHMEIVESYDSDSCIMAIRNFEAIRGVVPVEYFSDNGTHFTGANNELKEEFLKMDPQVVAETMNSSCTKWNFNPPAAPHMGGVYERLIQSVKNNLEKAMPTRTPTYPMLKNFICEITNIINSRPLTFLPIDSAESEALTPNHFLFGSSNGMRNSFDINPDALYLKRQWKMSQQMIDRFRKRWILEYLPTLTRRTKWFDKVRPIEVGDVVIVMDEKNYRNTWPKGIVVETFKGKGDQIRSARVHVTQSKWEDGTLRTKARISKRPAAKLALLDIESKDYVDKLDVGKDANVKGMPTEEVDIPGGSNVGRLIDTYVWNKSSDKNSNLKRLAPPTASLPTSKSRRQLSL